MKKTLLLLPAVIFTLAFVSCQKGIEDPFANGIDSTGTGGPIGGGTTGGTSDVGDINETWKFVSLSASTHATNTLVSGGTTVKTITTSDYTTINNGGTVTFDGSKMTSHDMTYAIKTVAKAVIYENGVLEDSVAIPMEATAPTMSGVVPYTRIGSDSLYFQTGFSFTGTASQNTNPSGARLKREQDKLYILQTVDQTFKETVQGETYTQVSKASVKVTLQKQ